MWKHTAGLLSFVFALSWAAWAAAADVEAYSQLAQRVAEIQERLNEDNPVSTELREEAVQAYGELVSWFDGYFAEPEFADLAPDQQAAARTDRHRLEFNIAQHLIALERCDESRDRLRGLLDVVVEDDELRPRLAATYDEAIACLNRVNTAALSVTVTPADAEVLVDGVFVGLATVSHDVELGDHTLTLRADGYEPAEQSFSAQRAGEEIAVGPIALVVAVVDVPPAGKSPQWHEWTLWGLGAAGIGTGIGFFASARDRQNTLDNLPDDEVPLDPQGEQDTIDTYETIAYISGGVGLASAILGTVLYVTRDAEDPPDAGDVAVGWTGTGVLIGLTF